MILKICVWLYVSPKLIIHFMKKETFKKILTFVGQFIAALLGALGGSSI